MVFLCGGKGMICDYGMILILPMDKAYRLVWADAKSIGMSYKMNFAAIMVLIY